MKHPERQFLPAAMEIEESPPSPLGRALALTIMACFATAIAWAIAGEIDIVATAQGRVIPSDRVKVVQPLEIGVVRSIHVQDGQPVRKGQVLIELDPTASRADVERLQRERLLAGLELSRLNAQAAALSESPTATPDAHAPAGADSATVDGANAIGDPLQGQLLDAFLQEYRARTEALAGELAQRKAELRSIEEEMRKLERTLPLVAERAASVKRLADRKLISSHASLELEQERIEQQQDLAIQRSRADEVRAAIGATRRQMDALRAESRRATLAERAETERRLGTLDQEIVKARQRTALQQLSAPIDGIVQQLAVHTQGGVVTPAQQLLVIVPDGSRVEVEAMVQNKDIGFVDAGQAAEIKVETFPFTRYGTIDGDIVHVSQDAIADERQGLVYTARVRLHKTTMQVDNRTINLSPGMAVTVEIKTGTRRLIEYVLSPLLRYRQESMRER